VAIDKLTIDTPEQVHLEFALADIGSRFMAKFGDTVIQVVLIVALIIIYEIFGRASLFELSGVRLWVTAILWFIAFSIYWGYFAVFEALWNGQTPGKRWAGIRVIKETGRPITACEAIARNLMRAVDGFPGIYAVGIITMLLNPRNRRLGDFVAGTIVVHDRKREESQLFFNTPERTEHNPFHAERLTAQEIALIETFLARRLDIPPDVRRQNGIRIAGMIADKLGIEPSARPADNENFLELVVRQFRNTARFR
jgi:uncharacterized RDD family membrane protein YckC